MFEDVDFDEPHTDRGHGFDSSVCEGCPEHKTDGLINQCGLCGCPTAAASPMALLGQPPESCLRLEQHEDG